MKNNSDELDDVAKPNCESYQDEEVKQQTLPQIKLLDSKKKRMRKNKSQLRLKSPSKSAFKPRHHNCKACEELQMAGVKAAPIKFMQDYEKLRHYTQMYSTHVQAGKIVQAEACISKIKANHPILFRLQNSTCQYLIKHSRIHFLVEKETLYNYGQRFERAIYILLFGRCKMKFDRKTFGLKMGTGYTFNEETLFEKWHEEMGPPTHTESLITCEESAFLRISLDTFMAMTEL